MVERALALGEDAVILDLEDGVPWPQKDEARRGVTEALAQPHRNAAPDRFVRVNSVTSELLHDDLAAIVGPGLDGVVLPKVKDPDLVIEVAQQLDELEAGAGLVQASIKLVVAIETARGLNGAVAIACASSRLIALIFGGEDFALDLGLAVTRTGAEHELLYARSALVVAAAVARVQAIDQVWTAIHDIDGLRSDALGARALGFSGKCVIHPGQIDVVNEVFRPTHEEVAFALRVVAAYDDAQARGIGVTTLGGQLVEVPIVERAHRVLDLHASLPPLAE
jgi:citrate lyase subunit beta/citryl-CoA lyase